MGRFKQIMNKLFPIVLALMMSSFVYSQCQGDVNEDYSLDVLDIVLIVNHIIGDNSLDESAESFADYNEDSTVDILDIVSIVNIALDGSFVCEYIPEADEICDNEYNFITGELLNCDEDCIEVDNQCYMESDLTEAEEILVNKTKEFLGDKS